MRRRALLALVAATLGGCTGPLVDTPIVSISGGTFVMGSATGCSDTKGAACLGDRVPHKVRISSFTIQDTEVTRRQYAACVKSGACPAKGAFYDGENDRPVLVDDPELARTYCASLKTPMRLPTEAEFEFASRTGPGGVLSDFPWGSGVPPTCARLPLDGCGEKVPRRVGDTPGDVSAWGVHDLAGSVPEWVEDSYQRFIGCADHIAYGELCTGRGAGCAEDRCATDGTFCAHGCMPAPAESTSGGDARAPVCPMPPDAALVIDPVFRGGPLAVFRGGGPEDGACAFAGFTRRHAAPQAFLAGFRCAQSGDLVQRKGAATYRMAILGCPPSGRVRMSIRLANGQAAGYSVDWFPAASPGVMSATAAMGTIDELPCDAVMVIYPQAVETITVKVSTVGNLNCLSATKVVTLTPASDTPATGIDQVQLANAVDCS